MKLAGTLRHNYCICIQSQLPVGSAIRILDTPRLHRQRKGRRKTVTVLDHCELAEYFGVAPDRLKPALLAAEWQFHEDANGQLWAVAQGGTPAKAATPGGSGAVEKRSKVSEAGEPT